MGLSGVPRMTSESLIRLYNGNFLLWHTSPNCPPQGHRVPQEERSRNFEQTHEILETEARVAVGSGGGDILCC